MSERPLTSTDVFVGRSNVVEQTFALLHQFRRLAVRWARRLDIHDSFVSLACVLICWRKLINWTGQRSC